MRRALAAALTALVLTGCASEDEPSTSEETLPTASETPSASASVEPSPSPSTDDTGEGDDPDDALQVEIEGESVAPNGKRVKATAGEPVVLEIESDRAAELHVHSSPEQVLEVKRGTSRVELTITTPGVVDVEEHETGIVILQLEVR